MSSPTLARKRSIRIVSQHVYIIIIIIIITITLLSYALCHSITLYTSDFPLPLSPLHSLSPLLSTPLHSSPLPRHPSTFTPLQCRGRAGAGPISQQRRGHALFAILIQGWLGEGLKATWCHPGVTNCQGEGKLLAPSSLDQPAPPLAWVVTNSLSGEFTAWVVTAWVVTNGG